jgi:hypothetical protein
VGHTVSKLILCFPNIFIFFNTKLVTLSRVCVCVFYGHSWDIHMNCYQWDASASLRSV